jgi:hypothetical protein
MSGLAITVDPRGASAALQLTPTSDRGVAETRAGLGGTFVALGGWALVRSSPDSYAAVGVTWLGAAAVRLAAIRVDRPRTDFTYWAYLVAEIGFGIAGISSAAGVRRRTFDAANRTHSSPSVG